MGCEGFWVLKYPPKAANACASCGPGKVLNGLIRQINRRVKVLSLRDYNSFSETVEYLETSTEMESK